MKGAYIVVGKRPRTPIDDIIPQVNEALAGTDIIINIVAFKIKDPEVCVYACRMYVCVSRLYLTLTSSLSMNFGRWHTAQVVDCIYSTASHATETPSPKVGEGI